MSTYYPLGDEFTCLPFCHLDPEHEDEFVRDGYLQSQVAALKAEYDAKIAALTQLVNDAISTAGNVVGEFRDFMLQTPPANWMERNGAVINNASTAVPDLWAYLQGSGAWAALTDVAYQDAWDQLKSNPFNQGGCARFALNTNANTIRLPDTRGLFPVSGGMNGETAGDAKSDGIRNIIGNTPAMQMANQRGSPSGAFYQTNDANSTDQQYFGTGTYAYNNFDASRVVPVSEVNRPRMYVNLGCVYVGRIIQ